MISARGTSILGVGLLWLAGCARSPSAPEVAAPSPALGLYEDVTEKVGLDFVYDNGMTGDFHIAETMGGGGAFLDYDGDGDLDLFLVQGGALPNGAGARPSDRLLRNEWLESGRLYFTDVTAGSGVEASNGYGMGVATGDFDGDGQPDLYVTNLGANRLLRNLGGGRFADVTSRAGVDDPRWSVPALFFDFDGDGRQDLFVGNYLTYDAATAPRCATSAGRRDYCGAGRFPPQGDRLLRNLGDGTFEDATAEAGLEIPPAPALGALAADLDGDGRLDLYVANDAEPNHFWRNLGDGTFEEAALLAGLAVNGAGKAEASMGIAPGDVDGDGELDLLLTHLIVETHTLYRSEGGGRYSDATNRAALAGPSRSHTGFGAVFVDPDEDGDLDLMVANGAVQSREELVQAGDPYPLHEVNQLFLQAEGRFEAFDLEPSEVSRALVAGDVDNDGDLDILVTNSRGATRMLLDRGSPRRWTGVRLVDGELDPHGSRVEGATPEGAPRRAWSVAGGSYLAAHDPRLILQGVAGGPVQVTWPDGDVERWRDLPAGRYSTLRRGGGEAVPAGNGGGANAAAEEGMAP
ncbi:MAG: CRTAC1 family protein [Acidobacteriota bacterium]